MFPTCLTASRPEFQHLAGYILHGAVNETPQFYIHIKVVSHSRLQVGLDIPHYHFSR